MIYKFTLTDNIGTHDVHPIFKDDLAIDYERESQQMFFREKLNGNIVFVGSEALRIISKPIATEFELTIYYSTDMGLTWAQLHKSHFYKTDCLIDEDNEKVTVKPDVVDRYNAVLAGMEKEYNLIDLLPVTEQIDMRKRAIMQIYASGEGIITNILDSYSWEQDCDLQGNRPEDYGFAWKKRKTKITLDNPPSALQGVVFEGWFDNGTYDTSGSGYEYFMYRYFDGSLWVMDIRVHDEYETALWHYVNASVDLPDRIKFEPLQEGLSEMYADVSNTDFYMRMLCDVPSFEIQGTTYNTAWIEPNDPNYGGNLHYCTGWGSPSQIVLSQKTSQTPTKWGKMSDTLYYDVPDDENYFVPFGKSTWGDTSTWLYLDVALMSDCVAASKKYVLRDAYPLWSVLSVLLAKVGSNVTFGNTTAYSEFFYSTYNPLNASYEAKPYITPKSNIIAGEYTQPAMQAPITLAMVLGMLAKAFKCYWFIDAQNRLRIEHISWFKNGGSYSGTQQSDIDLTEMINPRNGKAWSYDTAAWNYDKVDMPSRYQYEWMDEVTDVFKGWPFDIVSPFVQKDKVEEISISNFTSDVDYMQIAPNNCSKDGFALLMPVVQNGRNVLPVVNHFFFEDDVQRLFYSQNWYASLEVLQRYFLKYDLPAWQYKWRTDEVLAAPDIQRAKKQEIQIPMGDNMPDVMKLVKTSIGYGQIEKMSLRLSSRMAKTTLAYDTYDENENE